MSCFFYYLLRVSLYDSWDLKDVVIKKCSKYLPGVALCFTDAELYRVNIKFDQVLDLQLKRSKFKDIMDAYIMDFL